MEHFMTEDGLRHYFLKPGFVFVSMGPMLITTILGSCVSVCLYDSVLRFGGMNHYLLPSPFEGQVETTMFGTMAIPRLFDSLVEYGSKKGDITARISGGAYMEGNDCSYDISVQNIEVARNILDELGIKVVYEATGGILGRKVVFSTETGDITVETLKKTIDEVAYLVL